MPWGAIVGHAKDEPAPFILIYNTWSRYEKSSELKNPLPMHQMHQILYLKNPLF